MLDSLQLAEMLWEEAVCQCEMSINELDIKEEPNAMNCSLRPTFEKAPDGRLSCGLWAGSSGPLRKSASHRAPKPIPHVRQQIWQKVFARFSF